MSHHPRTLTRQWTTSRRGHILFQFVFSTLSTVSSKYWLNWVEHWKPERCWDTINCRKGTPRSPLTYLMLRLMFEKDSARSRGEEGVIRVCVCVWGSKYMSGICSEWRTQSSSHREGKAPGATKKTWPTLVEHFKSSLTWTEDIDSKFPSQMPII